MNHKMKTTIKYMGVLLLLTAVSACRGPGGQGKGGQGGGKPDAGDLVERLDKDGDGKISKAEFDGPAEHFTLLDTDSDGFIDADEAKSAPPPRDQQQ